MDEKKEEKNKNDNFQKIEFLSREALDNKLVIFVGAGVSMNCGLPSWSGLVEKFGEKIGVELNSNNSGDILDIPEIFFNDYGKVEYYKILKETFDMKLKPHAIHETLKKLSPKYIVTTNYDSLIEDKVNENFNYDVITQEKELAYSQKNKYIVKMHGDLKNKNVVLKRSDFDKYEENFPLITTFVKSLFTTNTVLFIGYSLNDENVKNIMKWIKEILKDDFRKAYLVDSSKSDLLKKYQDKNNKTINKIYLEVENGDHGVALDKFLNDILEARSKKEKIFKGKFYEEIPYILDDTIKEVFKEKKIEIVFREYKTSNINGEFNKEIEMPSHKIEVEEINLLLKSNISKINGKSLSQYLIENNENIDIEEYEKIREEENKIVNKIIKFDFKGCFSLIESEAIVNPFLCAYCYFLKNDFSCSKNYLLETAEAENSFEKKIWAYSNIEKIEKIEKKFFYFDKERVYFNINVKKEYFKYFENEKTDLYDEVFKNSTIEKFERKFDTLLLEMKNSKNVRTLGGYSVIEKSQIAIRDFLNYVFFNGVMINSFIGSYYVFMMKYVEIIIIAYTNRVAEEIFEGKTNEIKELEYIDIFIILQIPYEETLRIFKEYKVEKIILADETKNSIIDAFGNYLENYFENKSNDINKIRDLLNRFLYIFNSIELSKIQVERIFNFIIEKNLVNALDSCGIRLLNNFIVNNKPSIKLLEKMIRKVPEFKNIFFMYGDGDTFIYNLFKIYMEKKGKEIKFEEGKIKEFYEYSFGRNEKNDTQDYNVVFYFSLLLNKNNREKFLVECIKKLEVNFSLNAYNRVVTLGIIKENRELEKQIINLLNKEFTKEKVRHLELNEHICNNYIMLTLNLLLEGKVTEEFKGELKNNKNEIFNMFIRNNGFESLWNYGMDRDNINLDKLEIKDLENFTKNGIIKLLEKSDTLKVKVKEYLKSHLKEEDVEKLLAAFLETV